MKASSGSSRGGWEPREIEVGAVFSRAWELYTSNLGRVLGVHILAYILTVVASVAVFVLFFVIALAGAALLRQVDPGILIALAVAGYIIVILINSLCQLYFFLGVFSYILKLVRGEDPSFNELFSGWPYLGRMLICSLLFFVMYAVGLVFLIVPGIIIMLMFSPYPYLLIDRNLPGIEALTESRQITRGNLKVLFLISLVMGGITLVPYFTILFLNGGMNQGGGPPVLGAVLMLGFMFVLYIFLIPFSILVGGTSYAEMTNQ
ncbi:MAG: hypothetical protein ACIAZJ_16010 [Gimesia chilikensis]|uniref:hypothetical protein n=1 Tax=Gimesia chilikensis TaxID=2605989 RepID=UPI0037972AC5